MQVKTQDQTHLRNLVGKKLIKTKTVFLFKIHKMEAVKGRTQEYLLNCPDMSFYFVWTKYNILMHAHETYPLY